jgi:hypothetical protein
MTSSPDDKKAPTGDADESGHVHGPHCNHGHHHHHHEPQEPFVRKSPKLGRNDPCHCGSGQKFKKCCGKSA